jgi:hypothetical protein
MTFNIIPARAAVFIDSQLHGLLTNSAITAATMQDRAIIHLAGHDAEFDRVPGLMRYAPV